MATVFKRRESRPIPPGAKIVSFRGATCAQWINAKTGKTQRAGEGGVGLRTRNSYMRAIKTFTRWLWHDRRLPEDPLLALAQYNDATDRRHVRRELTPEELIYLLYHVERADGENFRLSGPTRAVAYRVALGTGFRREELRSLTPAAFNLDGDPPTVTVAASYSKRRRVDMQPIRPDLAELLRPWLAGHPRNERVFRLPDNTSKMFQRDLATARAAWIEESQSEEERQRREKSDFLRYRDADGRVADFHSQRHTYISDIVAGGASVKTAQELARHSTPTLTIGRYAHTRLHDLTGALSALPDLRPADPQPQSQQATGTDGEEVVVDGSWEQMREQLGGKTGQNVAQPGASDTSRNSNAACRNALPLNTLGDKRRDLAAVVRGGVEPPTLGFSVRIRTTKSSKKTADSARKGAIKKMMLKYSDAKE